MRKDRHDADSKFERRMGWIQLFQLIFICVQLVTGNHVWAIVQCFGLLFSWVIILRKDLLLIHMDLTEIKNEMVYIMLLKKNSKLSNYKSEIPE